MTIGEIVKMAKVSQPTVSQTVREMLKLNLVKRVDGNDARERKITLTDESMDMVPKLKTQWDATIKAEYDLDSELPVSLLSMVKSAIAALEKQSYRTRIEQNII